MNRKKSNKIAIIGNMNNNGFALLRHLLDTGKDAYLLLTPVDVKRKSSKHFLPTEDTWYPDKYLEKIKYISTPMSLGMILSCKGYIYNFLAFFIYLAKRFGKNENSYLWLPGCNREKIKSILSDYSVLICSGEMPAVLNKINRSCSLYFPYSIGGEYYKDPEFTKFLNVKNILTRFITGIIQNAQCEGLRKNKLTFINDSHQTQKSFEVLDINILNTYIPIVYPYENPSHLDYSEPLKDILKIIKSVKSSHIKSTIFMSHSRHYWINKGGLDAEEWRSRGSKNNNWIVDAFSRLISENVVYPLLIFFEYGPDVEETKLYCKQTGIEKYVYWSPLLSRKEILILIKEINVGLGEFYNSDISMGGAQLEFLAMGKPLITGRTSSIVKDADTDGFLFEAESAEEIYNHMYFLCKNKPRIIQSGMDASQWYKTKVVNGFMSVMSNLE